MEQISFSLTLGCPASNLAATARSLFAFGETMPARFADAAQILSASL
jgi:hypothetical protein